MAEFRKNGCTDFESTVYESFLLLCRESTVFGKKVNVYGLNHATPNLRSCLKNV